MYTFMWLLTVSSMLHFIWQKVSNKYLFSKVVVAKEGNTYLIGENDEPQGGNDVTKTCEKVWERFLIRSWQSGKHTDHWVLGSLMSGGGKKESTVYFHKMGKFSFYKEKVVIGDGKQWGKFVGTWGTKHGGGGHVTCKPMLFKQKKKKKINPLILNSDVID